MPFRKYYSLRTGSNPEAATLSFESLKDLFASLYRDFSQRGYFAQNFGFSCVDEDHVAGSLGSDLASFVHLNLHKPDLWPIDQQISTYNEDDVFDVIEFLFDFVSKPTNGHFHDFANCGMHWKEFDQIAGQSEYRQHVNRILERYADGYVLADSGEILQLGPLGVDHLYEAKPPGAPQNVTQKINSAVARFRRHGSSIEDRHGAVRDLADVLEYVRKQIKTVLLKSDENELFNLANNFGIRHFNETQKVEYDRAVWLSWIFYHYLATIHAFFHLVDRQKSKPQRKGRSIDDFPNEFLDSIRTSVKISDIASERLKLTRAGREWKGLCPFHKEKTPSFYVNDVKGFFHCFGCGAHGDVIKFLADSEGLSNFDTVTSLARRAGLAVPT